MNTNETTEINDLTTTTEQQDEVKGGQRSHNGYSYVTNSPASAAGASNILPDLEPQGEIKGGPGSGAGGVWLNHNETVEVDKEAKTEPLADLEATNAENIKGGPPYPPTITIKRTS